MIQTILNIIIPLIQKYLQKPPIKHHDTVYKPKKQQQTYDKIRRLGNDHLYSNDKLYVDTQYDKRKVDKCLAVLHYSGNKDLQALTDYLTQSSGANATWGVGQNGETHAYLPDPSHPSWTQGLLATDKGGFIDYQGKWTRRVNDIACSFEIVGTRDDHFTEAQYKSVAVRLWFLLEHYENFRLWLTTSHEAIVPIQRNDPGPNFDYEKLFCKYLGMKNSFFKEYLSYLPETSAHSTVGNAQASERKLFLVKQATEKIKTDLIGKPKTFGLQGV